jgi:hypothetical protein
MYRLTLLAACFGACLGCASTNGQSMGPGPEPTVTEPAGDPSPPPASASDGAEGCRRAVTGDSPVARACRQGGVRSAKATMKELVKQGQGAGLRLACDDCHLDVADFSRLSPEAPEKFRTLLLAIARN